MTMLEAPKDGRHVVCFYENDDDLVDVLGADLAKQLAAGRPAVVVALEAHAAAFDAALTAAAIGADERSGLLVLDARTVLDRIMDGDSPDPARFAAEVAAVVRTAAAGGDEVLVFGELVGLLWEQGNVQGALEIEALWEQLAHEVPFRLVCGYPATGEGPGEAVRRVCDAHTAVVGKELAPAMPSPQDPQWGDRQEFDPDPQAPRAARHFVVGTLRRREPTVCDEAALVVTELATNAVLHAGTRFTVEIERVDGVVRIGVRDDSAGTPAPQPLDADAESGRGLALVTALARAWGVEPTPSGKRVWVELPV